MTSDRISSFTASLVGRTIAYAVDDVEGDRFRRVHPDFAASAASIAARTVTKSNGFSNSASA